MLIELSFAKMAALMLHFNPLLSHSFLLAILLTCILTAYSHPQRDPFADATAPSSIGSTNSSFSSPNSSSLLPIHSICGTGQPSEHLKETHAKLQKKADEERVASTNSNTATPLVIETVIHWVTTADQAGLYSPAVRNKVIANQVCRFIQILLVL